MSRPFDFQGKEIGGGPWVESYAGRPADAAHYSVRGGEMVIAARDQPEGDNITVFKGPATVENIRLMDEHHFSRPAYPLHIPPNSTPEMESISTAAPQPSTTLV